MPYASICGIYHFDINFKILFAFIYLYVCVHMLLYVVHMYVVLHGQVFMHT